jgi:cold shock CspA family protein
MGTIKRWFNGEGGYGFIRPEVALSKVILIRLLLCP